MNYYNENDPKAAAWLRELIKAGLISAGEVDERSITDVQPNDLSKFTQCHFFAGIGGWSYALRLAGVPDDAQWWTGSCPCQPFSGAGKQLAEADPRHLWPQFRRLIAECRPARVSGEQVASALGRSWLSRVRSDLEELGYGVGAADLCAASAGEEGEGRIVRGDSETWERLTIGAPHIRQRLYWMADYAGEVEGRQCGIGRSSVFGWLGHAEGNNERRDSMPGTHGQREPVGGSSGVVHPDNAEFSGLEGHTRNEYNRDQPGWIDQGADRPVAETGGTGNEGMGNAESRGCGELRDASQPGSSGHVERPSWSGFDIVLCRDTDEHGRPKARRIESGTFPLADGVSGRVELLRGYGNAIVPELAAEFIQAYLETKV